MLSCLKKNNPCNIPQMKQKQNQKTKTTKKINYGKRVETSSLLYNSNKTKLLQNNEIK